MEVFYIRNRTSLVIMGPGRCLIFGYLDSQGLIIAIQRQPGSFGSFAGLVASFLILAGPASRLNSRGGESGWFNEPK